MSSAVTEFIETTAALVKETIERITDNCAEFRTVRFFPGTSYQDLFEYIPELRLPAAVVIYQGSDYGDVPRRTASFSVLTLSKMYHRSQANAAAVTDLAEKTIAALDRHVLNQAVWEISDDEAVDLSQVAPQMAGILVRFDVLDH